jgi:hypothetical protein
MAIRVEHRSAERISRSACYSRRRQVGHEIIVAELLVHGYRSETLAIYGELEKRSGYQWSAAAGRIHTDGVPRQGRSQALYPSSSRSTGAFSYPGIPACRNGCTRYLLGPQAMAPFPPEHTCLPRVQPTRANLSCRTRQAARRLPQACTSQGSCRSSRT